MLSTASIKYHHGPIEKWRKTSSPEPSIILTFDNVTSVNFSSICQALYQKFDQTTFGTVYMRQRKHQAMRIEAQVPGDQERRHILRSSIHLGSMLLNVLGYKLNFKAWPTLPHEPTYRVYCVQGLSLQSEYEVREKVLNGAGRRLIEIARSRGSDEEAPDEHVIDAVPAYDANGGIPLFSGTVYVVLDGNRDFGSRNYFKMDGKKLNAGSSTTHFAYCMDCRSLDSHLTDDCPFPIANWDSDEEEDDSEYDEEEDDDEYDYYPEDVDGGYSGYDDWAI